MSTTDTIKNFKYRLFYFSRNLEHVLFDEQNPADDEKFQEVDNFLNNLTVPLEEFLKEHMHSVPEVELEEQYKESWLYIRQNIASLQRNTNVPLLFEYLKEIDR